MRKNKFLSVLIIFALTICCFGLLTGCGENYDSAVGTTGGKTFRIFVWNDEFQVRFKKYIEDEKILPSDVKVEFVVNASQDNVYQSALDVNLEQQMSRNPDKRIDMFLIEADYASKYTSSDRCLDVINEIGLTEDELKDQYQYTKDAVTFDGKLKAVSWQACPGAFIYRRSFAKEVLGSEDPTVVQGKLDSWDKFDAVAKQMKDAGYFMLSGYDDDYRVFANNKTSAWVDDTGKIVIDPSVEKWIDQTKTYTEKGYNNKASLWSTESQAQMGKDGKVFGYFGPAWFMDFCFMQYTLEDPEGEKEVGNGSYGDWAMCNGPQSFYWGGTWICGARGTDNIDLVKKVMQKMTCDKEVLGKITEEFGDFVNNVPLMTEYANDEDFGYPFLGNQNHIAVLLENAKTLTIKNNTIYDQTMTEKIQLAFKDYFDGNVTKDVALKNFKTSVLEKHQELKSANKD